HQGARWPHLGGKPAWRRRYLQCLAAAGSGGLVLRNKSHHATLTQWPSKTAMLVPCGGTTLAPTDTHEICLALLPASARAAARRLRPRPRRRDGGLEHRHAHAGPAGWPGWRAAHSLGG